MKEYKVFFYRRNSYTGLRINPSSAHYIILYTLFSFGSIILYLIYNFFHGGADNTKWIGYPSYSPKTNNNYYYKTITTTVNYSKKDSGVNTNHNHLIYTIFTKTTTIRTKSEDNILLRLKLRTAASGLCIIH